MRASSYRLLDAANSNMVGDLIQHNARRLEKKTVQSWRVSGGLSALPHEPAQTTDAPKKPNRSKPQKRNERKLSNEKDEKSMCSVTRSVVRFPACLSVRRRGQQQQQQQQQPRTLAEHCRQYHRFQ